MDGPLAYFLTWTTYGTWLPGRRSRLGGRARLARWGNSPRIPSASNSPERCMVESAIVLDPTQRDLVDRTIRNHSRIRGWVLHEVNVRTNHVHVVVTADRSPDDVILDQFKAWATRHLKVNDSRRRK